jgi:mycothiol system anti-sigma-R factor
MTALSSNDEQYRVEDLMSRVDDCKEALSILYDYLDGELTEDRRRAIKAHLEGCAPCLQAFDWEAELKAVVARCCKDQVPQGLRERIARALAEASDNPSGIV